MRLVGIRSIDTDRLGLDFLDDAGDTRTFVVTYERSGDPPITLFTVDEGFLPYQTVPSSAWPDELDFRRFRDVLAWFREAARVEWAADEGAIELREARAKVLGGGAQRHPSPDEPPRT